MSNLAKRKTRLEVVFSDAVRERRLSREVVMTLTPYCISVRLKGTRTRFEISPAGVYNHAVRIAVEKKLAEKKKQKAGAR